MTTAHLYVGSDRVVTGDGRMRRGLRLQRTSCSGSIHSPLSESSCWSSLSYLEGERWGGGEGGGERERERGGEERLVRREREGERWGGGEVGGEREGERWGGEIGEERGGERWGGEREGEREGGGEKRERDGERGREVILLIKEVCEGQ